MESILNQRMFEENSNLNLNKHIPHELPDAFKKMLQADANYNEFESTPTQLPPLPIYPQHQPQPVYQHQPQPQQQPQPVYQHQPQQQPQQQPKPQHERSNYPVNEYETEIDSSSCESSIDTAAPQDEFYLYQQQLKSDVKTYLDLDDQIKALNKAVKERRTSKGKLAESILSTMKKFEIENMNTKNGRLIYSVKKTTKGLNKKNLLTGLNMYFKDEEKAKDATTIVLSNREVVEKVSLKRSVNKKTLQLT